jgi:serine/threonine protein kinase
VLQLPVTIEGRYHLEAAIASGGFATVYLGTQLAVQRRVAVKIITPPAGNDVWIRRAEREAVVLGRLKHPATVTVFDYGMWDGRLYLVMEYVEGDTLYKRVREQGPLTWQQTARIALDVLGSLGEAHELGILHRDLKPANIMVSTNTRGKMHGRVLDFGIAALMPSDELPVAPDGAPITQDGFVGTPRYASPEHLTGQLLSPASDLYAVGLILWECLVGSAAVSGNRIELCLNAHLGAQPWQLPQVAAPTELVRAIERALLKDPSRRWQRCEEMALAIEATLANESADSSLRSGEFARVSAIIDPNLEPGVDGGYALPELLTAPPQPVASRPQRREPEPIPARDFAPLARAAPLARDATLVSAELVSAEPITPRRPIVREPLPSAPSADPKTTRRLLIGIAALCCVAAGLVYYAQQRDARAATQRDALAADKPALLRLPPVQQPKPPPLPSVDGMIAALEAADWVVERRDAPTRLGSLEVQEVTVRRRDALVVLSIVASPSRDQVDDYLSHSKKDLIVYSGLYGVRVAGKNAAGRRAAGEALGRLELWRAMVDRESAKNP